jgi:macrolide transport system ATP-binding/permease protein
MREMVIELEGVTRSYPVGSTLVPALRGIDLRIERGEFIAIMGPSGSGKSTLMHIIGCLDRPSGGDYRLEGRPTAPLDDGALALIRGRRIGFVFQSFNLLPRTSAAENVALPLLYAGPASSRAQRLGRAQHLLERVGLASHAHSNPNQLSGGQQQRVALARALINDPAILLADEPTGNLDSATAAEIMDGLRALNRDEGVTLVLVTHAAEIAAYADRVVTLRDGRVASDVVQRPRPAGASAMSRRPIDRHDRPASASLPLAAMTIGAAARALATNKLRAALTALGIFIGVASLIAMTGLGQGAREAVRRQVASLGTSLVIVLPGAATANGVRAGNASAATLTVADADAIAREDGAVARVSYANRQVAQVQYGSQNWSTAIQGVTPAFLTIQKWRIEAGRSLTSEDDEQAAMVCVIGQTVYRRLFSAHESPVGASLLVNGRPLRIVGLLASRGQSALGNDQDDMVVVAFNTAERKVTGVAVPAPAPSAVTAQFAPAPSPYGLQPKLTGVVNLIFVEARTPAFIPAAMRQVNATLERRHLTGSGRPDDFTVRDLSQIAATAESSSRIIALLLAVVASISLLVGGIGIMNILLVSVTERTREIGIRMALGARRRHVLLQFLVEAALLSVIGGTAGLLVGMGASAAISYFAHWPTIIWPSAVAGSLGSSLAIGILFGYYPAHRAAHLDPIDALRFE